MAAFGIPVTVVPGGGFPVSFAVVPSLTWLLSGGVWSDTGAWDDAAVWEDS